jgi:adenosylmethionine-8-amino-7-oxononanoate aminotransferase
LHQSQGVGNCLAFCFFFSGAGNGVYIQAWMSHFVIAPPLIISKEEIDRGVSVLDEALALADSEVEKKEEYGGYGCE